MTSDSSKSRTKRWSFECQVCGYSRDVRYENDALDEARDHDNHAGHFDFEITDPDGEVQYP